MKLANCSGQNLLPPDPVPSSGRRSGERAKRLI